MRALVLLACACSEVTTVSFGADEGVGAVWYDDTLFDLPKSYTADEIPDGVWLVESLWGDTVTLDVRTRADGGRDVTLAREVPIIDAGQAVLMRHVLGERDLAGVELELLELTVDDCAVGTELRAGGARLDDVGSVAALDEHVLGELRARLADGEAATIPISLTFRLAAEELDAVPAPLHLFVLAQPTLYIDAL